GGGGDAQEVGAGSAPGGEGRVVAGAVDGVEHRRGRGPLLESLHLERAAPAGRPALARRYILLNEPGPESHDRTSPVRGAKSGLTGPQWARKRRGGGLHEPACDRVPTAREALRSGGASGGRTRWRGYPQPPA